MADSIVSTAASSMDSAPQPVASESKPKNARTDQAHRAETIKLRRRAVRAAECKKAGVPYTMYVKFAKSTAKLTEQERKAARPEERVENKQDVRDVVREENDKR